MRSLEQQERQISTNLAGHLFSRVDPSSAVILYSGTYFKKSPIGYYYFTRIGWQLYEIVGETQEGLFSCIFSPPKSSQHEVVLVGTVRFGRQQLGRIRVTNKRDTAPFIAFHPIGSTDCMIAEVEGDHLQEVTLVHSELGEILKIDRNLSCGSSSFFTRGCVRSGEFLRPVLPARDTASLRVIILATTSAILSHDQFELPAANRF